MKCVRKEQMYFVWLSAKLKTDEMSRVEFCLEIIDFDCVFDVVVELIASSTEESVVCGEDIRQVVIWVLKWLLRIKDRKIESEGEGSNSDFSQIRDEMYDSHSFFVFLTNLSSIFLIGDITYDTVCCVDEHFSLKSGFEFAYWLKAGDGTSGEFGAVWRPDPDGLCGLEKDCAVIDGEFWVEIRL